MSQSITAQTELYTFDLTRRQYDNKVSIWGFIPIPHAGIDLRTGEPTVANYGEWVLLGVEPDYQSGMVALKRIKAELRDKKRKENPDRHERRLRADWQVRRDNARRR